jgi:hypothetical protein
MTPADLEEALIQLAIAETALIWTTQTTGTWAAIESIRRVRKALTCDDGQREDRGPQRGGLESGRGET